MKKLLILLLLSTSLSTFADSHLDFSLSDFCYKMPKVQDRGGIYYLPNEDVGITASSLCIYEDQYGQYASKVELVNGKFNGQLTEWHENGQIELESNWKDGELYHADGKWTSWHDNGQIRGESHWKDNKLNGKETYWYENGQIKSERNYKDGKLDGKWTKWDENGQIKSVSNWKHVVCISGDCPPE